MVKRSSKQEAKSLIDKQNKPQADDLDTSARDVKAGSVIQRLPVYDTATQSFLSALTAWLETTPEGSKHEVTEFLELRGPNNEASFVLLVANKLDLRRGHRSGIAEIAARFADHEADKKVNNVDSTSREAVELSKPSKAKAERTASMAEATTYENLSSQFLSASSPEELGLWFLSVRTSAGMTQKEVAKRMDKQEADYAKLERGEGNPTFKTIQKFCSATSTPIFN